MKIGFDIDDVLYPWADTAHKLCEQAGITNGKPISTWRMWEGYGCTLDEWKAVVDGATATGELYDQPPIYEAHLAMHLLADAGHEIHLVTARGCGWAHSQLIRYLTERWLAEWSIPHHSLTFAKDKAPVALALGLEIFVDDRPKNYDELDAAGVPVYLLNHAHNHDPSCNRRRVSTVMEFASIAQCKSERGVVRSDAA